MAQPITLQKFQPVIGMNFNLFGMNNEDFKKTASEPNSEQAFEAASEQASEQASEPASEKATEPGSEQAFEAASQQASESASLPALETIESESNITTDQVKLFGKKIQILIVILEQE